MGFLLGAFGKLAAGSRYRGLQARLMRVQSRLRRATRQAADMEKMINQQEKAALNNLSLQKNYTKQIYNLGWQNNAELQAVLAKTGGNTSIAGTDVKLSESELKLLYAYQQGVQNMNTNTEISEAKMKQDIQDYFEQLRDSQLDPLKDEEDLLQSEKDSLESQIQIAKADYEACQKMEQADAKMMTPNYTGGQG